MFRRILFIVFVCIAVAATVMAYLYLRSVKKPKRDITSIIPANCSYIVECDNFIDFGKKLRSNSLVWEELVQDPYFSDLNESLGTIDSVVSLNEDGKTLFENNRIYLAGIEKNKTVYNLFAINLKAPEQEDAVVDFLKKHFTGFENLKTPEGEMIHRVATKKGNEVFFVYCSGGILLVSKSQELIESSLSKGNNAVNTDKHFLELEEDGGNNMDARIYLRNSFHHSLFSARATEGLGIASNKGWTALDLVSHPNEIRMNGFIDADSSLFLQALMQQEPVEIKFTHFTPKNTSAFSFLGISDYASFASVMMKNSGFEKESFDFYSARTDAGLANEWSGVFGGEFALVTCELNNAERKIGLASLSDNTAAAKLLGQVCDSTIPFTRGTIADSVLYCKRKDLFPLLTFNVFDEKFSYVYVSNEYALFAPSDSIIRRYLDELAASGNLAKTDRFENAGLTNLNTECNYYHYRDLSKCYASAPDYLNGQVTEKIKTLRERLKKFGFMGVQLSAHKGKILLQSSLQYNPVTKDQSLTLWETQLDTISSDVPQVLLNHKTGGKELFVSDDAGTIYLVSNTGKVQWKKALGEKPMSKIYQVDFFKNGKLQMLFNTKNAIHLIDRNGNYVTGYPIALSSPTTNALAVYDYENTKDYRILLACENKRVYNYNINGKITDGFNFPQTQEEVNLKVEFVRINGKDYLLAIDKAGNLYCTTRKGEPRLAFKNKLAENIRSYYLDEGKDISRTVIYYADLNEPALKQIAMDDKTKSYGINTEIKIKDVNFGFVNEDRLVDYIISDESGFEVLDDAGNRLLEYITKTDSKPGVKSVIVNNQVYFLMTDRNAELHLVDIAGKRVATPDVYFSSLPVITDINGDAKLYMIGVRQDKLNCYEFRE